MGSIIQLQKVSNLTAPSCCGSTFWNSRVSSSCVGFLPARTHTYTHIEDTRLLLTSGFAESRYAVILNDQINNMPQIYWYLGSHSTCDCVTRGIIFSSSDHVIAVHKCVYVCRFIHICMYMCTARRDPDLVQSAEKPFHTESTKQLTKLARCDRALAGRQM